MTKKKGRCGFISREPYRCLCHKGKRVRCTGPAGHSRSKDAMQRLHWMGNHVYCLDNNRKVRFLWDSKIDA